MPRSIEQKNFLLSLFSAVLLVFSYPNVNAPFLIWVGLVPLLFLLEDQSPKAAFLWGWLTGFLFFIGTHYWLIHVTMIGMVLLCVYLGIFFGLFSLGYTFFKDLPVRHKLWVVPSLWVALEFIRDRLFTGFGWACLGHSQYKVLPIIQIADIAGVFGVSFLVVMVNVLFKNVISAAKDLKRIVLPTGIVIIIFGLVLVYGYQQLSHYIALKETNLWGAVIQPNISQSRKWDPDSWEGTQKRILELTKKALAQKPGLVIWPETSFPGYIWQSPDRYEQVKAFVARHKVPLLFGTVMMQNPEQFYNSAILLSAQGKEVARYDKMHLVPFGEFLPLRPLLNFIENFIPIGDFARGERLTVFPQRFSVLICFEDTAALIVRMLVKQGPLFLVNITNDGWFKDTNEPHLHMQGSVFQAVAHRRAIIRAANTGVSGDISPAGVQHVLRDDRGKSVMVDGFMMSIIQENSERSFYTVYGDVFAYLCFFIVVLAAIKRKILL